MKAFILVFLVLGAILITSCGTKTTPRTFQEHETGIQIPGEFFTKLADVPEGVDPKTWEQFVYIGYMELARLSQTGRDISYITRPDEQDLEKFIDNLPGFEPQRVGIAFWVVREMMVPDVLYTVGTFEEDFTKNTVPLQHVLTYANGTTIIGGLGTQKPFIPLFAIQWDEEKNEFSIGYNLVALRKLKKEQLPVIPL